MKPAIALLALLMTVPPLPAAAQVAAESPAEAARVAAPLREELLGRMDSWRPVLFAGGDSDPVKARYGGRYDALEESVRGQRHPGDIARSRYAFAQLLDDALHDRRRQDKRDGKDDGGFTRFRQSAERRAEVAFASAAAARAESRRVAALTALPSETLFDGVVTAVSSPLETTAVETEATASLLPSRGIAAAWSPLPDVMPGAVIAHAYAVNGAAFVSYNNGETRTGGTRAWRDNNPGNIIAGPWATDHGAIAKDEKGYAIFPDVGTARSALDRLLRTDAYQELPLNAAVAKYAPPSENPTDKYVAYLSRMTGVDEWAALSSMTREQFEALKKWITVFEGSKPGSVIRH